MEKDVVGFSNQPSLPVKPGETGIRGRKRENEKREREREENEREAGENVARMRFCCGEQLDSFFGN